MIVLPLFFLACFEKTSDSDSTPFCPCSRLPCHLDRHLAVPWRRQSQAPCAPELPQLRAGGGEELSHFTLRCNPLGSRTEETPGVHIRLTMEFTISSCEFSFNKLGGQRVWRHQIKSQLFLTISVSTIQRFIEHLNELKVLKEKEFGCLCLAE